MLVHRLFSDPLVGAGMLYGRAFDVANLGGKYFDRLDISDRTCGMVSGWR